MLVLRDDELPDQGLCESDRLGQRGQRQDVALPSVGLNEGNGGQKESESPVVQLGEPRELDGIDPALAGFALGDEGLRPPEVPATSAWVSPAASRACRSRRSMRS